MESELFAKKAYELLAQKAEDEDVKALALQLATFEEEHYERIKKAYELFVTIHQQNFEFKDFSPGGYLFDDKTKARYFFMEVLDGRKGIIFSRDPPEEVKKWMKMEVSAFWVTSKTCHGCISPRALLDSLDEIPKEKNLAILIENLEILRIAADDFEEFYTNLSKLKDEAVLNRCYLVLSGSRGAFEDKEWKILESEFNYIS